MKVLNGFTLIEMMVVLAVLAIIVTAAVPGMGSFLDSNKLRGATGDFYADMQYARSESIKRNINVSVSITSDGGTSWCYGISTSAGCDCTITDSTDASACVLPQSGENILKVGVSSEFTGIRLTSPSGSNQTVATFDPVRGIATTTGSVVFESHNNLETHVEVSALGKVNACTPSGGKSVTGYSTC